VISIATFVVALALAPAFAQRGGGHMGAAMGRGGFVGGGGRVAQGGLRFGGGFGFGGFGGFGRFGRPGFFPGHFHHNRFFFGFGTGFYYPYAYSYYPSYPYYPATYPTYDYSVNSYQQQEIIRELDHLSDEVERLREQQETLSYVPRPGQQQPQAATKTEAERPTVLVFRDKHIQEVQNYAVVGETLWIFSEQQAKKVPLSQLDLDATAKLNEERGLEFPVPKR
jgi:hypothetical protein